MQIRPIHLQMDLGQLQTRQVDLLIIQQQTLIQKPLLRLFTLIETELEKLVF